MPDLPNTLDAQIELFLVYMSRRGGRNRNAASVSDLAKQFKCGPEHAERVMAEAHQRGLVHRWRAGDDPYYVRNLSL